MPQKKAYLVMPRTTAVAEKGLATGKGTLKFKKGKTSMLVSDESLAREIDTQHGLKGTGDVWVAEDQRTESFLRDDGLVGGGLHHYFFGASPRYSRAWEEFEKRRKDKNMQKNMQKNMPPDMKKKMKSMGMTMEEDKPRMISPVPKKKKRKP